MSRIFPSPSTPARRAAGFSLVEVMIGLSLFIIAGLSVMEVIGLINQNANVNRARTAARMLVQAKISKAQTDTFTTSNKVYPISCIDPSLSASAIATAGYKVLPDPFDSDESKPVTIIGSDDTGPVITGMFSRSVSTFESSSRTLRITYSLTFNYRGKDYTVTQSTVRAPDQL